MSKENVQSRTLEASRDSSTVDVNPATTINVVINSIIKDRYHGASVAEKIWEEVANVGYIAAKLQDDPEAREVAATFLMNRSVEAVFKDIIGAKTFRAGGILASKSEIFESIVKRCANPNAAAALTEMLLPAFIKNQLVSGHAHFTSRRVFGHEVVSVNNLRADVMEQELNRAIKEASAQFVVPSGVHSTRAMAEKLADAYVSVGTSVYSIAEYSAVIDDIVLGVFGNIAPLSVATHTGSVPEDLKRHTVVQSLMNNLTFVSAALSMLNGYSGTPSLPNLKPACEGWRFDKWATVVYTMLRASQRYAIIGRNEFLATIGTVKVRNLEGKPVAVVVYDNAAIEPAAMAVIAQQDVAISWATCMLPSKEKVAEHIVASYGALPEKMSVRSAAYLLVDTLTTAVEADEASVSRKCYDLRLAGEDVVADMKTIAVLMSDSISVTIDSTTGEHSFVFRAPSVEKTLKLQNGAIHAGTVYTTDPVELFLALEDREPTSKVEVPPQFLPSYVLHTRMIGVDPEVDFVPLGQRLSFSMDVFGTKLAGSLRLRELSSIRLGNLSSLVIPVFNRSVIETVGAGVDEAFKIADSMPEGVASRRAKRAIAGAILGMAQALTPGFRQEIHNAIVERTVAKLTFDESVKMRSKLSQIALAAFVDVFAAELFLHMQGLGQHVTEEGGVRGHGTMFSRFLNDDAVRSFWSELGSDRN